MKIEASRPVERIRLTLEDDERLDIVAQDGNRWYLALGFSSVESDHPLEPQVLLDLPDRMLTKIVLRYLKHRLHTEIEKSPH
jgi:hypothetical protein